MFPFVLRFRRNRPQAVEGYGGGKPQHGTKAWESLVAISAEMPALPLITLLRACRVTPSALAASVTDKSSGSRQSSLMDRPGCGGFFIDMVFLLPI
jgi:hypothetical protein